MALRVSVVVVRVMPMCIGAVGSVRVMCAMAMVVMPVSARGRIRRPRRARRAEREEGERAQLKAKIRTELEATQARAKELQASLEKLDGPDDTGLTPPEVKP